MPSQELLGVNAAARYLGFHPDTVRGWAKSGAIAYSRTPNGRRYFKRADLDAFIVRMRVEATEDSA